MPKGTVCRTIPFEFLPTFPANCMLTVTCKLSEFYGLITTKNIEMINEEKLAEFLEQHKRNAENFNEEGNYDPNPYWLAEEIVKLCNLQNVTNRALLLKIERLEADNKLLNFMVENGLGEEDMINDITYPHEL